MPFAEPKDLEDIEVYELTSSTGKKVELGIGSFRSGYDLWMIDPETGNSLRA